MAEFAERVDGARYRAGLPPDDAQGHVTSTAVQPADYPEFRRIVKT